METDERKRAQRVINALRADYEYEKTLRDLAEARAEEAEKRIKNLERQILRLMSDRTYQVPEVA